MAIANKNLVAAYRMLAQQVFYNDLGDAYLDKAKDNLGRVDSPPEPRKGRILQKYTNTIN